ncbi:MAG: bifunctional adenosylcobinamide kinase/adenosylcobinamide-phosphate guanylyltransferase [Candidatus Adiutrix sp.]
MGKLTLYLGGAKSGKTRLALAEATLYEPMRIYLATAEAFDDEMRQRIENHKAERGLGWRTIEEPLKPDEVLSKLEGQGVLMLDCLTLWLSNLLAAQDDCQWALNRVNDLIKAAKEYKGPVIIVSNEVGHGIVPANSLARKFRDLAGSANQMLAAQADTVILVNAGLKLYLK